MRADVTVDDRFVRFGSKSYAINKITSIDVRSETTPGKRSARALLWVMAAAVAILAIVPALSPPPAVNDPEAPRATVSFVALAIAALFGWLGWAARDTPSETTYRLFLMTNAGEAQAMETNDRDEIVELREAIEDAMAQSN